MSLLIVLHHRPAALTALMFVAVTSLVGCVGTREYVDRASHDAARSAVQGAAEGLPSLTEPLKKTARQVLLDDDTLSQVSQRLTESTLASMRSGLAATDTRELVDDLVGRTMTALGRDGGRATADVIRAAEPELSEALRRATAMTMTTLRENLERDLIPRTRVLAQANAEVLLNTLAASLDIQLTHVRQAARDIGRDIISEAAATMRDRKDFVGEVTHVAMLQAVRGAREGVWETLPGRVPTEVVAGMMTLVALLILSAGGLVIFWWRYRQSTKSLTIIAQQINERDAGELKQAIHQSAHANYVGPWLSNFLKARGL